MASRPLLNLLTRHAIEGKWDAEQAEINEAIFKAMDFDHDKTRVLIRMPEVRAYVEAQQKQYPLGVRAIRAEFLPVMQEQRNALKALRQSESVTETEITSAEQDLAATNAAQEERISLFKKEFFKNLGTHLRSALQTKTIREARGWKDVVGPEIEMYRLGAGDEGRGMSPLRGQATIGSHASAEQHRRLHAPGILRD